jgi:hypothetical protein
MLCSVGLCPYSLCIAVDLLFCVMDMLFRSYIRWVYFLSFISVQVISAGLNEFSTSIFQKLCLNPVDPRCPLFFNFSVVSSVSTYVGLKSAFISISSSGGGCVLTFLFKRLSKC